MERAITPADCTLAVALPLSFEEFAADAESPEHDFARSVIEGCGRSPRATWDEVYAPKVVQLCERVAAKARSHGSTVLTRATAGSLRELLAKFPAVCLVAHSVQTPVEPADILDPNAILRVIDVGGSVLARHLQARLGRSHRWSGDDAVLRAQIAALFEEALEPTRAWIASTARRDPSGRPGLHMNRVLLEDCFGGALRRGRLLELRDGMKTMDDLLAAIPPGFSGVLDLAVCNSIALGESIRRRRPDCLVIENTYLARVDLRLVRHVLVLTLLAKRPARYTDALFQLNRELVRNKP